MIRDFLLPPLFLVLASVCLMSWVVFHVVGGLIHILLVLAVFSLVAHVFRGKRTV
jgi:hypothetical protein